MYGYANSQAPFTVNESSGTESSNNIRDSVLVVLSKFLGIYDMVQDLTEVDIGRSHV